MCCIEDQNVVKEVMDKADAEGKLTLWKTFAFIINTNAKDSIMILSPVIRYEFQIGENRMYGDDENRIRDCGYNSQYPSGFHCSVEPGNGGYHSSQWGKTEGDNGINDFLRWGFIEVQVTADVKDLITAGYGDTNDPPRDKQAVLIKFILSQEEVDKAVKELKEKS